MSQKRAMYRFWLAIVTPLPFFVRVSPYLCEGIGKKRKSRERGKREREKRERVERKGREKRKREGRKRKGGEKYTSD